MGWTSYHYDGLLKTNSQKKMAIREQFGNDPKWGTILKDSLVGNTYYAAVKYTKTGEVFALVVLISVDNKDYYNMSYKDMVESSGPYQIDCPVSILNLLSPTDNEYALNWRKSCRENAKRKNVVLKNGDIIEFEKSIQFQSGRECRKFRVVKEPRKHTYFYMLENNGGYCTISGWKKMNYKIVS